MSKIIEIEELGFPKSLIIRYGALVSELIDTKDLVNELNEQLRQCNVSGRSEQLLALAQYMCEHQNNLDGKTAKDYLQDFLSQ